MCICEAWRALLSLIPEPMQQASAKSQLIQAWLESGIDQPASSGRLNCHRAREISSRGEPVRPYLGFQSNFHFFHKAAWAALPTCKSLNLASYINQPIRCK